MVFFIWWIVVVSFNRHPAGPSYDSGIYVAISMVSDFAFIVVVYEILEEIRKCVSKLILQKNFLY